MEIALYSKIQDPVKAIVQIGEFFAKSTMFGCERVEQGQVLAMECLATGKPPSVIARTYHIMDGKLSKKALAALAEFRGIGGKHKWVKDGTDGKEAVIELTFEGNVVTSKFTIEEAQKQGLIRPKSNWEKTPANMLRARAISNGVAMLAPEIYAGDSADEDGPTTTEAKPLLRETPTVTASPANESHIDVAATVVTQPEAKPEPKTEASAAEVKKYTAADIAIDPGTQRLTVNAMAALESVIGDNNQGAAIAWLKAKGWIQTAMSELSVDRAKRIMNKPEVFVGYITKAV